MFNSNLRISKYFLWSYRLRVNEIQLYLYIVPIIIIIPHELCKPILLGTQ